jgi:hypothetical protein
MVALRQASNWRRAKRARTSSISCIPAPPPPANWNWRTVPNFPSKTHVLTILERHLAEGVVAEFFAFFANFTTGWQSTRRTLSHYVTRDLVLPASDFATLPHARK